MIKSTAIYFLQRWCSPVGVCLGNTSILVKFDTGLADNLFFARHSKRPWSLGTADLIMRSDLRLQLIIRFKLEPIWDLN